MCLDPFVLWFSDPWSLIPGPFCVDTILTMAAPTLIGRYEIVAELGRGAMGSVFRALDPAVGRTVALKTIHSAALSGEHAAEYRARFYREARASGVLAHPAIVPVFDVGEHEGAPYLVMEFVEGRTLDSFIKKGERFPLDRVCDICQQLADALGYAHRQGVIHRDIKPANILLTSREVYGAERPRITDFGIAKLAQSELTTTGQMLGTPSFMPPEQFTGAPIDGRADLFSLGVILYSLATGEQPFPGETMTTVSYKVVHVDPVPPSKLNPAISPGLEAVILKSLAKNPAIRYQTGEEFAQDLAALHANLNAVNLLATVPIDPDATLGPATGALAQQSSRATAQVQASPGKKSSKSANRGLLAAVALAAVAAAGAGGWYMLRMHQSQPAQSRKGDIIVPPPTPIATTPAPAAATAPAAAAGDAEPSTARAAATPKPSPARTATVASRTQTPTPSNPPAAPPAKAARTQPQSTGLQGATTAPAARPAVPAAPAIDPHKLDPSANSKFKIELSHLPNGLPISVQMNKSHYLSFVTGDKTDLNNLFVPPGIQTFRVTALNGGQQVASNIVSSEFKARKRKNLKIELRNQGKAPAGAPPLSPGAQIFVSLTTPLL
jgi:serine/threonine-protein kinase